VTTLLADGPPTTNAGEEVFRQNDSVAIPVSVPSRLAEDPAALEECYRTFGPTVHAYLRRRMAAADAEDVLQQTFLELWRSRSAYDPSRSLEAFILGIARKRSIDLLRRDVRRPTTSLDEVPDGALSTASLVQGVVDADEVRRALDVLPPEQRDTIELSYFAQMTQAEIAEALGVPLGTVKARAARGLRRLAAILMPEEE